MTAAWIPAARRRTARLAVTALCVTGVSVGTSVPLSAQPPAAGHAATSILSWDQFAAGFIVTTEQKQQPESYVYMAYVQAAVYDAVTAVDGGGAAYLPGLAHHPHASVDAAAASAAYRVLSHFFGAEQSLLDMYNSSLAAIPVGTPRDEGVTVGADAADAVLSARADDGFTSTVTYLPTPGPGVWQPTPPAFKAAQTPQIAAMRPFILSSASQFLPPPPPALGSTAWSDAYNEVKDVGSAASTTRTADETATATYWTGNVVFMYNQLLRDLATARHLDARHAARLLVSGNMVGADALIACMNAKYYYGFWRPVTAIQAGDTDGNADTEADAGWLPMLTTPNHPEYPSNHGCISSAEATITSSLLGTDDVSVGLFSTAGSITRHFGTVSDWLTSVGNGRVWGGIHYRFSTDAGVALGRAVADYDLTHGFLSDDD